MAAGSAFLLAAIAGGWFSDAGRSDETLVRTAQDESMTFVDTPAPVSRGPSPGPANLAFVSARTGFAATTGGLHFVARTGWIPARYPARIQRTDDGGVTWRTLWSARNVAFRSIAVSGATIVASGYRSPRRRCCPALDPLGRALVVASSDRGRTWRRRPAPPGGGAVHPLTPRVWVVTRRGEEYPRRPTTLLRSDDAGRHWRRRALPRGAELVRFASGAVGFASARGVQCPRASQLWRTGDGGRTWAPVPRTCGPPLADLDVVSERVLFAAHADPENFDRRFSVVRRSDDGGLTWRTVWRDHYRGILDLAFSDTRRVLAVVDQAHADGYVSHRWLRASADGGRTWSDRALPYARWRYATASTDGAELPTAFWGRRHAWAGDEGAGIVWRTADGGRTWRLSADPGSLAPSEPTLGGPDGAVTVRTAAGPATSRDGGRTWQLSRWPPAVAIALAERRGADVEVRCIRSTPGFCLRWRNLPRITQDGGKTWRRVSIPPELPREGAGEIAFSTPRDGLLAGGEPDFPETPVFSTHDEGRTWRRIPVPPGVRRRTSAFLAPGIVVLAPGNRALITVDEGRTWQSFPLPDDTDDCDVSRPSEADIWVVCTNAFERRRQTVLLTSRDGGQTWVRRTTTMTLGAKIAALSGDEAWSALEVWHDMPAALWHTTDGGATWRRVWVTLDPSAPVLQVTTR